LLGSANLSRSALCSGVEADIDGEDSEGRLLRWFNGYFHDDLRTSNFDDARLAKLEIAFSARAKSKIAFNKVLMSEAPRDPLYEPEPDSAVIMETLFSKLGSEVTPLNFDNAANNLRSLHLIMEGLDGTRPLTGKTLSELKLLGLVEDGEFSELGQAAKIAGSAVDLAKIWMAWLKRASAERLLAVSPTGKLVRARNAFQRFWMLPAELTEFFIANSQNPSADDRKKLQTIELLANANRTLPSLTLDDVEVLSSVLSNTSALSQTSAEAIVDYLRNKAPRGWRSPDRRLAVEAWRDAAE
jgi:hypothetical protein